MNAAAARTARRLWWRDTLFVAVGLLAGVGELLALLCWPVGG